jgi:hypothetical protein
MARRRKFLLAAGAILAFPLAAEAQLAGKVYRIGYLGKSASSPEAKFCWMRADEVIQ